MKDHQFIKRALAVVLALAVGGQGFVVSAAQLLKNPVFSLADANECEANECVEEIMLDCPGWWQTHTFGVELKATQRQPLLSAARHTRQQQTSGILQFMLFTLVMREKLMAQITVSILYAVLTVMVGVQVGIWVVVLPINLKFLSGQQLQRGQIGITSLQQTKLA